MLRVALSLIVAAGFTAVVSAQDQATIDKGMKLYEQQKCSVCHSIAGKGSAKGPLDEVGSKLKADEIRQWLVDPKTMTEKTKAPRRPIMRAYANLPKEDLDALVAYMLSLTKK
jgi:mono/diheme cytochrome c family protein